MSQWGDKRVFRLWGNELEVTPLVEGPAWAKADPEHTIVSVIVVNAVYVQGPEPQTALNEFCGRPYREWLELPAQCDESNLPTPRPV